MLQKPARLTRGAFLEAYKKSSRVSSVGFFVLVSPSLHFRASVVVPKKVDARAVVRNVLKRRFYAALRELCKETHAKNTYIVMVQKEAKTLTYSHIKKALARAFPLRGSKVE